MAKLGDVKKAIKRLDYSKPGDRAKVRTLLQPFEQEMNYDNDLCDIYVICGGPTVMQEAGYMVNGFSKDPKMSRFPSFPKAVEYANSLRRKL
ncbi:hypothetical protein [Shimazuella alba]|uniref:Uncharacterized protein n=1 Tax=Shimazuella alba TaxID=2690964 RepID=A0A6I4VYW6_9BACL|nr:hypothetical protein [Shimazuella alba]MXQ55718.1 hypothetical protein [Shimazuella alba]